jgi:hypothetical protein
MLPVCIVDLSDSFFALRNKRSFVRVAVLVEKAHNWRYDMYLYEDGSKEYATGCRTVCLDFVPAMLNIARNYRNHLFITIDDEEAVSYLVDRPLPGYPFVFDEEKRRVFKEGFLHGLHQMGFLSDIENTCSAIQT